MQGIQVRKAKLADISHINRLQHEAFPGDVLLMSGEEMRHRIHGEKKGALLVATLNELIVAYCVLTDRPFRFWTGCDFLAVRPSHHRLGIATKLIDEAFRSATRPFVRVFTESANMSARALYRKSGFRQTGRKKRFYSNGDDAVVLLGQRIVNL